MIVTFLFLILFYLQAFILLIYFRRLEKEKETDFNYHILQSTTIDKKVNQMNN